MLYWLKKVYQYIPMSKRNDKRFGHKNHSRFNSIFYIFLELVSKEMFVVLPRQWRKGDALSFMSLAVSLMSQTTLL